MLTSLRRRFIDHLKAAHSDFRDIKAHYGRLEESEIEKISAQTPAARVGLWGRIGTEIVADGQIVIRPGFAIAVITKSTDLIRSHDEAMRLSTDVVAGLGSFVPGAPNSENAIEALPGVGLVENISLDISNSNALEAKGIALWGVLCNVPIRIGLSLASQEAAGLYDVEWPTGFENPEDAL